MTRRGPLIVAGVSLLLAIGVFLFLVSPKMGEVSDTQEQLDQARQEQVGLEAQLAQLEESRDRAAEIRRQLVRIRRQVPPAADLPGLLNLLQDAADASEVDFFSISPGDPVPASAGDAAVIPAQITVIGGFFAVDEFLFRLETLPRAAKVVTLTVADGPEGAPQLDLTMTTQFYTRDETAGPGAPVSADAPEASPSPTASPTPTPTESPTEGT